MSPCSRSWSVSSVGGCAGPPQHTTSRPGPSPSRSRSTSRAAAGAPGALGLRQALARVRHHALPRPAPPLTAVSTPWLAAPSARSRDGGTAEQGPPRTIHPDAIAAARRTAQPRSAVTRHALLWNQAAPRRQIRRRHGLLRRFLTREALSRPRQASSTVAQAVPRRSHLPAARQRRRPRNRGAGRRANPPPPPRLRSIPLASGSTATSPSHPTSRPGSSTLEQLAARAAAGTTAGARGQAATAGPWTRPPSTWQPGPLRGVSGCGLPRRIPSPDGGSTKARSGRPLARRRR